MRIKHWTKFQHFKDRNPTWIKLYKDLLNNVDFFELSDRAGKYLPLMWLVSSERGGALPETKELAFRLRLSVSETDAILAELKANQFLTDSEEHDDEVNEEKNQSGLRHISDSVKREVWERDNGKCQECGSNETLEYVRNVPVSRGGNSNADNVQLLCRSCSRKKRWSETAYQATTQAQTELRNSVAHKVTQIQTESGQAYQEATHNSDHDSDESETAYQSIRNSLKLCSLEKEREKEKETTTAHRKIEFDFAAGEFRNVNGELKIWEKAFPAVSISGEMAKAAAWLMANPKNRKSNYARFLTNWLTRAQDRAKPQGGDNFTMDFSAK